MKRRALLGTMTVGLVAPMLCGKVFAQSPNDVKLVIPFPAGGGGDVLGRSPLDALSKNLGKDIWVLNRPAPAATLVPLILSMSLKKTQALVMSPMESCALIVIFMTI